MKGILLAGGTGSRLFPLTRSVSKQLLPVYDKPLVYYPLSTLMLAGIRDLLVITSHEQKESFQQLLRDGRQWGIEITYAVQEQPNGIAEALLIGETFLNGSHCALILGDNIFYGQGLGGALQDLPRDSNARILAYEVADPTPYAVVEVDESFRVLRLEEKPKEATSTLAVPGLYFFPPDAPAVAQGTQRSNRGELEITDVNQAYLTQERLDVILLPRGTVWMDAGTFAGLHDASSFVRVMEERTGSRVSCPEEIAWRQGWISDDELEHLARQCLASGYGGYLLALLDRGFDPR